MKMRDLKAGLKPFFIFIILFQVIYVLVTIILGYPMLIIADKIRRHKYFKKRMKESNEEKNELQI